MKAILFFLFLSITSTHYAKADSPSIVCSLLNVKRVKAIAVSHSSFDKNRHCTVSCMLSLKCGPTEAMTMGILKEIQDLFGPGDADMDDLAADALGVDLASTRRARTDSQCLEQCDLYYP